jgi:CheY-like chemotaxis protein
MVKRMLIFDDDKTILKILKYILEAEGWEVLNSLDSNNVIAQVSSYKPSIIMMDNNIPDSGGIVATQSIKLNKETQHIPVIFFTASTDIKELCQQAGADAYLAKPFDLTRLFDVIKQVYSQKQQSSETSLFL